ASGGGVGPRRWRGKLARRRTERWITGLVEQIRRGGLGADPRAALHAVAPLGDSGDRLGGGGTPAGGGVNLHRPTRGVAWGAAVAIAWYVAFAALALHTHPLAAEQLARAPVAGRTSGCADWFTQEVRRFYPLVPYLTAQVRSQFTWRGHVFDPGTLVLLDVYG